MTRSMPVGSLVGIPDPPPRVSSSSVSVPARCDDAVTTTSSSTWAPAGGAAVDVAVSFETSEDDAEVSPSPVVLSRPPVDGGEDPTPCEVTVKFTGKYEIHRVYVRSTARIYEIYYSTDPMDTSKDYLCTVRCGLVAKEPLPSGEENMSQGQCNSNAASSENHEQETKSVTSSCDEDSWVEVKFSESLENKASDSKERNVNGTCQKSALAYYEATAEISDASPCASLTVRFLSLQSKTTVHIEEIYIFADPVQSSNDDSVMSPGNMGGSSLLAMLVPGLMQMSKSKNCKEDERYISDGLRTQLPEGFGLKASSPCGKIAQEPKLYGANDSNLKSAGLECRPRSTDGIISSEKDSQDELSWNDSKSLPAEKKENAQPSVKDQTVSNTYQHANPPMNGNFTSHCRIDSMLDTLLSKVEKMELYCSRFEDNMMSPLSRIETRLQRLEQQFDLFSVDIQSLRVSHARVSAPNSLFDTTNSLDKSHNDGNARTSASITNRRPGLVIRAPDFSSEDSCCCDIADENPVTLHGPNIMSRLAVKDPCFIWDPELTRENAHRELFPPVDSLLSSEKKRKTSPGLAVKIPEFTNDEDDEVEEDKEEEAGDHDDGHAKCDDTRRSLVDSSKGKQPVTVDGALSSALAAFLTSTKLTPLSKFVACTASNSSARNITDSSWCSPFLEQDDDIPAKDGSIGQFSAFGDANKVRISISNMGVDVVPHTSLSEAYLTGMVEVNEQNIDLNSDEMTFGSTELLEVPSRPHTESIGDGIFIYQGVDVPQHTSLSEKHLVDKVEINEHNVDLNSVKMAFASTEPLDALSEPHTGATDDVTEVNGQNNDDNSDTMSFVISTEPLDDPSQPSTLLGSAADGSLVNEEPPTIFETGGETPQVNENGTALFLAEFLIARDASSFRNDTTEVCCGNDSTRIMSFKRTSTRTGKDSEDGNSTASQENSMLHGLLLKKPLEADDDSKGFNDISMNTCFEASSYLATSNGANRYWTDATQTASVEDADVGNTEDNIMISGGMGSIFFPSSENIWIEVSSLDSGANESFTEPKMEHCWSDRSSKESFGTTPISKATSIFQDYTAINDVKDLFAATGTSSTVTPMSSEKLHLAYDFRSTANITNVSSPSLEVLLGESSGSEPQISDLEDIDSDACSSQLFGTLSSSDDDAFATHEPSADGPVPLEAYASTGNEPLIDVDDLTNPSVTGACLVNEPLFDLPELSNIYYAFPVDEFCANADDLPKTLDGRSSEHSGSLI